jgi:AraC family transcriptional regulator of adaptative response / methylphosphotriester-DNA alkyltransferase methyltransferase
MKISDDEKWRAVVQCDKNYDGKFLYGVKTTGIFCRPSCKSKTPLRNNIKFFTNLDEAMADRLRPCKRCRPDLYEYQPMVVFIREIKEQFDANFSDRVKILYLFKKLNVSRNHFTRLFRQHFAMTPGQYLNKLRLYKAMDLLQATERNVLDIALECGFSSLSNFYVCFKREFGQTPYEYRRNKT